MISTFFGRKFRQRMSLQRSGKLFFNLFLHFCAPTHRHFINRHFLVYQNTSYVEFNHILHLAFCSNTCKFLDCFCICFMPGFKLINCLFHLRLCPQPDSNGICTIFCAILAHVRHICKPIGFQIGIFPRHCIVVCKCYLRKVVLCKSVRDRFNGFEVLGFDLDVSKACPIGNLKAGLIFQNNFIHNFLFLSMIKMVYKLRSNICSIYFLKRQFK
nr:MAG TPA: hypothetical protein [Caudoviricetes sp.]